MKISLALSNEGNATIETFVSTFTGSTILLVVTATPPLTIETWAVKLFNRSDSSGVTPKAVSPKTPSGKNTIVLSGIYLWSVPFSST